MKAVQPYLSNDGQVHTWDVANRGGSPLCGGDVFPLANQQSGSEPEVCLHCAEIIMTMMDWEDYQERG